MATDGYPTEDELKAIREWDGDLIAAFAYIKSIGKYWRDDSWGWDEFDGSRFGRPTRIYFISTGGWSGNEDIIDAMQSNFLLWSVTWQETRVGGHYRFAVTRGEAGDV